MIKVGLTGGIGSGKTTVARIFSVLGAPVFSADKEGKRLMIEDPSLAGAIRAAFGDGIYRREAGDKLVLDRGKLAAMVFNDDKKLARLNSLVHPAVIAAAEDWARKQDAPYVIKESALLFESDAWKYCDFSITVTAPEEERIRRVMQRDDTSRDKVAGRMKYQLSDREKISRADAVIINDDSKLLIPQVLAIHHLLLHRPEELITRSLPRG